jgi:hypothetical protein
VNAATTDRWAYMRYLVEKYAEPDERERLLGWLKERQAATDRQVARAAIRVVLRHLGVEGERELEAEIEKVVAEEAESDA